MRFFWSRADVHRNVLYSVTETPFSSVVVLPSPKSPRWSLVNSCFIYRKIAVVQLCRALREFLIFFWRQSVECTMSEKTLGLYKSKIPCQRDKHWCWRVFLRNVKHTTSCLMKYLSGGTTHFTFFAISHKQTAHDGRIFLPFLTLSFSTFCASDPLPSTVCASHTRLFHPAPLACSKAQMHCLPHSPSSPPAQGVSSG